MFRKLMKVWKEKEFLDQVMEEFKDMLEDSEKMFALVSENLIHDRKEPDLADTIYSIDRRINELEKNIRKRVIEHLAIQPSVDMPVSLVLMSVVKDAERLGDYSKNLLEINKLSEGPIDRTKYSEIFTNLDVEILDLFQKAKEAFLESDEHKAKETWEYERRISKRCDKIVEELARSDLSVNEAVCFTLMARYFKRLAAHLTNIATSVILPVSELDFHDEKR